MINSLNDWIWEATYAYIFELYLLEYAWLGFPSFSNLIIFHYGKLEFIKMKQMYFERFIFLITTILKVIVLKSVNFF